MTRFDILLGIAVTALAAGILALINAPPETGILAVALGGIAAWGGPDEPWQWPPCGGWRG